MSGKAFVASLIFAIAALVSGVLHAEPFALTSSAFKDGDVINPKHAGAHPGRTCGGENISPQLSWSNAPEKTQSFAVIMFDPDGGRGIGSVHWVAYGIPPSRTAFAEGEAGAAPRDHVGGKNNVGTNYYFGPCGPPGDSLHHYIFTVIATDLATDALPPGLTRDELLEKLKGHALAPSSIVARYVRKE